MFSRLLNKLLCKLRYASYKAPFPSYKNIRGVKVIRQHPVWWDLAWVTREVGVAMTMPGTGDGGRDVVASADALLGHPCPLCPVPGSDFAPTPGPTLVFFQKRHDVARMFAHPLGQDGVDLMGVVS